MSSLAPIVVFAYNRPQHLQRTLSYLAKNDLARQSQLYIFCDGVKQNASDRDISRILDVRNVAKTATWAKELHVICSDDNKGLATSVITGVSRVLDTHAAVIVLEDDLLVGKYFLEYMNNALAEFATHENVMQISGFTFPICDHPEHRSYFMPVTNTVGWGTWNRVWSQLDVQATGAQQALRSPSVAREFNLGNTYDYTGIMSRQLAKQSSNDSWGILFWWHVFSQSGIVLYPDYSLIQHKDDDNLGVHKSDYGHYDTPNWDPTYRVERLPTSLVTDVAAFQQLKTYLIDCRPALSRRLMTKAKAAWKHIVPNRQ